MPTVYNADIQAVPIAADGSFTARYYLGFAMYNTNQATPATVLIYDGVSAAGVLIDAVSLLPNESAREWYGDALNIRSGSIFVDTAAGVTVGIRAVR